VQPDSVFDPWGGAQDTVFEAGQFPCRYEIGDDTDNMRLAHGKKITGNPCMRGTATQRIILLAFPFPFFLAGLVPSV
jgi:hypothetical protein